MNVRHPEFISGSEWHERLARKMLKQVQHDVMVKQTPNTPYTMVGHPDL